MPCDTQYTTSPLDLGLVDRRVLADSLRAGGWRVTVGDTTLQARRYGQTITVGPDGAALNASQYTDRDRVTREILAGYTRLATERTVAKFGFRKLGETTLADGSIKITFQRSSMGASAKPLGKVGL